MNHAAGLVPNRPHRSMGHSHQLDGTNSNIGISDSELNAFAFSMGGKQNDGKNG